MGTANGGGTYDYNSSITLIATEKPGYKFVKWDNGSTLGLIYGEDKFEVIK